MDEKIKGYILDLVFATRNPADFNLKDMKNLITLWSLAPSDHRLGYGFQSLRLSQRRGYVTPEDVKSVGPDVLRHRIIPSFEAEAENKTSDVLLQQVFDVVAVP